LRTAVSDRGHRHAQTSRSRKRKAADNLEETSDAEDDFESMDIDQVIRGTNAEGDGVSDISGPETPQPLEDETETEDEGAVSTPEINEGDTQESVPTRSVTSHRDPPFSRRAAMISTGRPSASQGDQLAEGADVTGGETDDDEL
jgi:hypothetical protein